MAHATPSSAHQRVVTGVAGRIAPATTRKSLGECAPERVSVLLVARLDGEAVGAAGAEVDPGDPAEVEISVLPSHRRRGIGTALAAAVREALAGRAEVVQAETYGEEGVAFARAQGMQVGNQEHRLLLDLPVGRPLDLTALRAAGRPAPEVEVRTWRGACPEELVEDWSRLSTQIEADVPMGDLTRPASRADLETSLLRPPPSSSSYRDYDGL